MRKGLTLMEFLVVISILATLAALLFPVYLRVRGRMYAISCANQLMQIGLALHMYANDYGDGSPYFSSLPYPERLYPKYIRDKYLLICPRVKALAPSQVMEIILRGRITLRYGEVNSTYFFESPVGLDDLRKKGEIPFGFSELLAIRGDNVPIGYCSAHRFCKSEVDRYFFEVYGENGVRLCNELFFDPGGPILILRWSGKVDFVYKNVNHIYADYYLW